MHRPLTVSLVALATLVLAACRNDNGRSTRFQDPEAKTSVAKAPATQPTSFTGTLRGGAVAIGGETTGWRLEGDGQTGGIDVDVSKVRDPAKQLDGKRVSITGKMSKRSWPERGETQVLVADRIEPAPQPKK